MLTTPALLSIFIARPRAAVIRGLGARADSVGPSLGAEVVMTGTGRGFSRASLVARFRQPCQLLRAVSPVQEICLYLIRLALIASVLCILVVLIVAPSSTGSEIVPDVPGL